MEIDFWNAVLLSAQKNPSISAASLPGDRLRRVVMLFWTKMASWLISTQKALTGIISSFLCAWCQSTPALCRAGGRGTRGHTPSSDLSVVRASYSKKTESRWHWCLLFLFPFNIKKIKTTIREEERQRGGKRVEGRGGSVSFVLLMYFVLWQTG